MTIGILGGGVWGSALARVLSNNKVIIYARDEKIVKSMVSDFSGDNEKLEVYLCPQDLTLLKALSKPQDAPVQEDESDQEEGFASAIAGIFDGLDGDDELLDGYPNVKFFEDSSLNSGDCQIKSRFGLLDGRISTKLRKIEEELKRND